MHRDYWSQDPRTYALQKEKPLEWEAHALQLEGSSHSLQLERSLHINENPVQTKIKRKKTTDT